MQYGKGMRHFSEAVNKTKNALPSVPIVELAGDQRVLIENHRGVIEYGNMRICVKTKYGTLCICGSKLELSKMTKEQLVITGMIDSVAIQRKGKA